ncbi:MAG: tRNA lysidine(34) synthetase TilS [Micavibrio sp.]|nr:tRNA lysidine(34) synthetase TilS [Micavibrio sp.]
MLNSPAANSPLSENKFQDIISRFDLEDDSVAVGVSGGPDSMALAYCLSHFTSLKVHVLSIDHGLRRESPSEVDMVETAAGEWGCAFHRMVWEHDGVSSRLHEKARNARYQMMHEYMLGHKIKYLFLGHHLDDQAETFLFRLAKGSGLNGLVGMSMKSYQNSMTLLRPFLNIEKRCVLDFCKEHSIPYIDDPSNEDEHYARVRMRKLIDDLKADGFSLKRFLNTQKRLERASSALEEVAEKARMECVVELNSSRIVFNLNALEKWPEDIVFRCVWDAILTLNPQIYGPRMQRVENLVADFLNDKKFRKRTLGGIIFERNDNENTFVLISERDAIDK